MSTTTKNALPSNWCRLSDPKHQPIKLLARLVGWSVGHDEVANASALQAASNFAKFVEY
jgi:hypothetical protein